MAARIAGRALRKVVAFACYRPAFRQAFADALSEPAAKLGLPAVKLINDLEANAWGIAELEPKDFVTLNEGAPDAEGNAAVISVGTGLGEAGLYWDGHSHHAFACEGGHADFAPRNDLESELLHYLRNEFDHVSYERSVSGPGLRHVYEFFRDTGKGVEPAALTEEMKHADPSFVISRVGLEGRYEICVKALELFVDTPQWLIDNILLFERETGCFSGNAGFDQLLRQLNAVEAWPSVRRGVDGAAQPT